MGWWEQDEDGHSFAKAKTGEMVWGDGVADTLDNAIDKIVKEFEEAWKRKPTKAEMHAGLSFSLGRFDGEDAGR